MVLNRLARAGPNLAEYREADPPTPEEMLTRGVTWGTYRPSGLVESIKGAVDYGQMCAYGCMRPRRLAGKLIPNVYDYSDYRLITIKVRWLGVYHVVGGDTGVRCRCSIVVGLH